MLRPPEELTPKALQSWLADVHELVQLSPGTTMTVIRGGLRHGHGFYERIAHRTAGAAANLL